MTEVDTSANPCGYNVEELYGAFSFEVPIYQRVFTWGYEQFERLFKDLSDHFCSSGRNDRYYLGVITVVRQKDGDKLVLVDGQQRLTCILLLGALLDWNLDTGKLTYAARPGDERALERVYSICKGCNVAGEAGIPSLDEISAIANASMSAFLRYALTTGKQLLKELKEKSTVVKEQLTLMVSFLPDNPYRENIFEQNRYFEKMNYGGKQLEPHEILKVRICDGLDGKCLSIWNSVSHFGKSYCFQQLDSEGTLHRHPFSLCDALDSDEIFLAKIYGQFNEKQKLLNRFKEQYRQYEMGTEERDDMRQGLISFQTFLLHVRYLYLKEAKKAPIDDEEPIGDESHLLEFFGELVDLPSEARCKIVKLMEKYRQFLDSEIIHVWTVEGEQRYAFYVTEGDGVRDSVPDERKAMLQFQSMLYASSGTDQKWLLQAYAKYEEGAGPLTVEGLERKIMSSKLFAASIQEAILGSTEWPNDCLKYGSDRRWFALLDYLLWKNLVKDDNGGLWGSLKCEKFGPLEDEIRSAIKNYVFRKNRSVEHLHAQTDSKATDPEVWGNKKDFFGNLALISAGRNSEYGNDSVGGKADRVVKLLKDGTQSGSKIESIKLLFMLAKCNGDDYKWKPDVAQSHANEMHKLLKEFLSGNSCISVQEGLSHQLTDNNGEAAASNHYLTSREAYLAWIVNELDRCMSEKGFSRSEGSVLTDASVDDQSLFYEKDGIRIIFSTEEKKCASMYVGIVNKYAGGWDDFANVKKKLPTWNQYRIWCWHPLTNRNANWSTEFLMSCKQNNTILSALMNEIATLIQDAYTAMKQVMEKSS